MNVNGRGTAVTDRAGLEVLAREECLQLLAEAPIGRIVFTDHALPAVQPVNFAMLGTDIIIRTSPESKLAQAIRDTVVAPRSWRFLSRCRCSRGRRALSRISSAS